MSDQSDLKPLHDLVIRSQKIGADQSMVVYGGGNTSSKGKITDYLGRKREVLWVKGSGADMQYALDQDYPALYLEELLALHKYDELDDDAMVDYVTRALVDPTSRRPSIETLLHAFLPAKHIDHAHADAICALTNHKDGRNAVKEALGKGFAYVDWLRPGFKLSKLVSTLKDYEGVVLAHHGLIVWDDDSDLCFAKNTAAVEKAEKYLTSLAKRPESKFIHAELSESDLVAALLSLRGALGSNGKRNVLRSDARLREIADREDLSAVVAAGAASADHMLRIRPWSCAINGDEIATIPTAVTSFRSRYHAYFEANKSLLPPDGLTGLGDFVSQASDPKVFLLPGLGAITAGISHDEGKMLGDIALHTHQVGAAVLDAFGSAEALPDSEIFGFDYWPMELYKLKLRPAPAKFAGHIFIVTGAASGIGRAIALHLGSLGASLVLADLDSDGLSEVVAEFAKKKYLKPLAALGDQSDDKVVTKTLLNTIKHFGGLDGIVVNAGIGVSGTIEELTPQKWRDGLEINLTSAFLLTQAALRTFRQQNMGGAIVYIASKNAFSPGAGFGGYSVSKAGMLQLMRIAALEGGAIGVRANALNPDAIFDNSKLWEGGIRQERAAQHKVKPEELEDFYAARNLLKARVRSNDVAKSVEFLLSDDSSRTTGAVIAVDGGVAAAFPR